MTDLNWLALGGIGAAVAFLMPFWNRVVGFVRSLQFLIFKDAKLSGDVRWTLASYLTNKRGTTPFETREYALWSSYIREERRHGFFAVRDLGSNASRRVWLGFPRYIRFHGDTISTIRGLVDLEALIAEAVAWRRSHQNDRNRYKVMRVGGASRKRRGVAKTNDETEAPERHQGGMPAQFESSESVEMTTPWDRATNTPLGLTWEDVSYPNRRDMETLALTEEQGALMEEVGFLLDHRSWFEERSLPWRRGYLFHGAPGAGKTATARALGQKFGLPIYLFDLASLSNDQLASAWTEIASERPLIAVFEDIDVIYDGRQNVTRETSFWGAGVTFDAFLNTLDGADLQDGVITVVTTNKPERLDPALAQVLPDGTARVRPGRIDRVVGFGVLDEAGRRKIARRIMLGLPDGEVDALVARTNGCTGAEVQEAAQQATLDAFWRTAEVLAEPEKAGVFQGRNGRPGIF